VNCNARKRNLRAEPLTLAGFRLFRKAAPMEEKAHGRQRRDAVVEATAHRFRPILLTAAAAILGMIPIAPTIFWGPMAYAIMGDLAVATILTLIFLPALYVTWFRIKRPQPDSSQKMGLAQTAVAQPLT
jgi:Cu/Ag efflux pump CusA